MRLFPFIVILIVFGYMNSLNAQYKLGHSLNLDNNYYGFRSLPKSLAEIDFEKYQKLEPLSSEVNYTMLGVVTGVTVLSGVGVHIYQANAWWKEQSTSFKVVNDWNYALWIDKVGHFYATNLLAHAFTSGFNAADIEANQAVLYGSILAFSYEIFVEIEDGFGPNWGFSPGDAIADFVGASYYLAQYHFPVLKNIQPRFSYYPSKEQREGKRKDGNFIDDYHGQKYWLSFRMKELLPENISEYWPSIFMLSVGMGVKDLNGGGGGTREFYIALDLDAEAIPFHGKFWQFLKNTFNYVHLPMPGIRVSPDATFFVFCY